MTKSSFIFETTITALNSSGQGIGELNGLKIFIDLALPNEKVEAKLTLKKKKYAQGKLLKLLSTSKERANPICPIFSECGGCQIMHLNYLGQCKYKTEKVKNAFERIAKKSNLPLKTCLPAKNPLYYRNKILLPFFSKKGKPSLGLYKKRSHDLVELETCYIHSPLGQSVYKTLKELFFESPFKVYDSQKKTGFLKHLLIRTTRSSKQCLIGIVVSKKTQLEPLKELAEKLREKHPEVTSVLLNIQPRDSNVVLGPKWINLSGKDYLEENLLNFSFKIAPNAFFQVNTAQALNLFQKALEYAQLKKTDTVLDAYCGIGMFSIFSAPYVKKVYGIECVESAIESAKENAALNHFKHLDFRCASMEKVIHELPKVDVVFLNPPRKGCDPKVLDALIKIQPTKIIYVSCDPATLARDIATLSQDLYELKEIQPIDLFPQTSHVETIVSLHLKKDSKT